SAHPGCRFFVATGHELCAAFLDYFGTHGLEFDAKKGTSEAESLALFGLPISEEAMETNASGDRVLTQWFERARFEAHPENGPPYAVLLGLLGNEISDTGAPPVATSPAVQTATLVVTNAPGTVRRGNVATVTVHTTP